LHTSCDGDGSSDVCSADLARSGQGEHERVWQRKRVPPHRRYRQATQMPCRTSLHCGRLHKVWAMMSEIPYITVQDSLIFHHITPGPSLSRPAKDASPKARKSVHPLRQWSLKPTGFFRLKPPLGIPHFFTYDISLHFIV